MRGPALKLTRALTAWSAAEDQLAAAAAEYLQAVRSGKTTGGGTWDASEALRVHLAYERYHAPLTIMAIVKQEPPQ